MDRPPIRVLLVEDNPADARLLREALASAGDRQFELTQVERLNGALRVLQDQQFDAILLDVSLPDSEGLDTVIRTRQEANDVPIIVLTSLDDEAFGITSIKEGAQEYFVKGQINAAQLARSILYAIERTRVERELREGLDQLQGQKDERRTRILLVEDDANDSVLIKKMLAQVKDEPFEVDWVQSYDDALEALNDEKYDVCLLDYRLGPRDGLDLLREAAEIASRLPIIMFTGQGKHEIDLEAMRLGAVDYLVKGQFKAELLARSIRYAIERKGSERKLREQLEKLESVVQTVPIGLIISDQLEGRILYANALAAEMLGTTPKDITKRSMKSFYVEPSDYERLTDGRNNDGGILYHEVRLKKSDEIALWVVLSNCEINFEGRTAILSGFQAISWGRTN